MLAKMQSTEKDMEQLRQQLTITGGSLSEQEKTTLQQQALLQVLWIWIMRVDKAEISIELSKI